MRALLRVNAVLAFVAAVALLSSRATGLDLPADTQLWGEVAGALLLGLAYLLWLAPRNSSLMTPVALAAAVGNAGAAIALAAEGSTRAVAAAAVAAAFAAGELYIASRSVAMLMPRD
jgi:hypothetical protein